MESRGTERSRKITARLTRIGSSLIRRLTPWGVAYVGVVIVLAALAPFSDLLAFGPTVLTLPLGLLTSVASVIAAGAVDMVWTDSVESHTWLAAFISAPAFGLTAVVNVLVVRVVLSVPHRGSVRE